MKKLAELWHTLMIIGSWNLTLSLRATMRLKKHQAQKSDGRGFDKDIRHFYQRPVTILLHLLPALRLLYHNFDRCCCRRSRARAWLLCICIVEGRSDVDVLTRLPLDGWVRLSPRAHAPSTRSQTRWCFFRLMRTLVPCLCPICGPLVLQTRHHSA